MKPTGVAPSFFPLPKTDFRIITKHVKKHKMVYKQMTAAALAVASLAGRATAIDAITAKVS